MAALEALLADFLLDPDKGFGFVVIGASEDIDLPPYGPNLGTEPISFRASVVRNMLDRKTGIYTWRASINDRDQKQFPDKEAAMAYVERELRIAAGAFFEHWSLYTAPNKRAQRNL